MIAWAALAAYLLIAVTFGMYFAWSMWGIEDGQVDLKRLNWSRRVHAVLQCFTAGLLWPLAMPIRLLLFNPPVRRWMSRRVDNYIAEQRGGTLSKSPRWWSYTATRLAHFQPALLLLVIATDLVGRYTDYSVFSALTTICMAFVIVAVFAEHHHERRLCTRCAAATPTDGESAAQDRRLWLRFQHWHSRHGMFGLVGWAIGLTLSLVFHFASAAAFYPLYLYWAAETLSNLRHRPVQPWCPQCKGWGWGDEDRSPIPVPTGQGHK